MNYNKKTGEHLDKYIKWFSDLSKEDINIAGVKGAYLGEMLKSKLPVPQGFVITSSAFNYFLKSTGLYEKISRILETIDINNINDINKKSIEIRNQIDSFELPKDLKDEIIDAYKILSFEKVNTFGVSNNALTILKNSEEPIFVAIRSSGISEKIDTSFSGVCESYLYIKGEARLIEFIKKCFSSLYSCRSIVYRNEKSFSEELKNAVIIMKMIDSDKSGVIFSKSPIGKPDDILIEAAYGLSEGINSGKIKPDNYYVKENLEIDEIIVSNKKVAVVRSGTGNIGLVKLVQDRAKSQTLTNSQIKEAANYSKTISKLFGSPQNIEFGIEGDKFYILQSRPITCLPADKEKIKVFSGNVLLQGTPASPGIITGAVKIVKDVSDLYNIKENDIIVSEINSPELIIAMKKSIGIITNEGGVTNHAGIVARELKIPCITGTENATQILKDGMKVSIDGYSGKVYEGEISETKYIEVREGIKIESIELKLFLDSSLFLDKAKESGLYKVGLFKIESIIASSGKHPLKYVLDDNLDEYKNIIKKGITTVVNSFDEINIRTSDIKTNEYMSLQGCPAKEPNPLLGLHGIRFGLKHPEIINSEISSISEIANDYPSKKITVLIPQLISIGELKKVKEIFNKYKKDNLFLGVIIETPSGVQIIESICLEGVDLIVIGTDDLIQYTLAIDKEHVDVSHLHDESHPSLISQIKRVIYSCRKNNVITGIYGKSVYGQDILDMLFKTGINSIYVSPDKVYDVSRIIKDLEISKEKFLLEKKEKFKQKILEKKKEDEARRQEEENKKRIEEERKRQEEERKRQEENKKRQEENRKRQKGNNIIPVVNNLEKNKQNDRNKFNNNQPSKFNLVRPDKHNEYIKSKYHKPVKHIDNLPENNENKLIKSDKQSDYKKTMYQDANTPIPEYNPISNEEIPANISGYSENLVDDFLEDKNSVSGEKIKTINLDNSKDKKEEMTFDNDEDFVIVEEKKPEVKKVEEENKPSNKEDIIYEAEIPYLNEKSFYADKKPVKKEDSGDLTQDSGLDESEKVLDLRKKNHYSYFEDDYV